MLLNLNWCVGDAAPDTKAKQMKWGRGFADLCFKERVKLVNYPVGLKPLGVPEGLLGSAYMDVNKFVKPIVRAFVKFWQQQAWEKEDELAGEDTSKGDKAAPLYADDEGNDDGEDEVNEEDLVRFVPWDDGKCT